MPLFGENLENPENTPFWAKISKIPHFGRKWANPEITPFWAKIPLFERKFRKYPIKAKVLKISHFGRIRPFLGENFENTPFWAKISKLSHFRRKCPFLGKNFKTPTLFWAKMPLVGRKFRNSSGLKLRNEIDIKPFKQEIDVNKHVIIRHKPTKRFNCEQCSNSFSRTHHLSRHVKTFHGEFRDFQCNKCTKAFGHRHVLLKHVKSVHERIKDFQCNRCSYAFSRNECLKTFKNVHQGIKRLKGDFQCHQCTKTYGYKNVLQRHVRSIHEGNEIFHEIFNAINAQKPSRETITYRSM